MISITGQSKLMVIHSKNICLPITLVRRWGNFFINTVHTYRGLEGTTSWPPVYLQLFNYFPLLLSPKPSFLLKFSLQKSIQTWTGDIMRKLWKFHPFQFFSQWLIVLTAKDLCLISNVNSFGFISHPWFSLCFSPWKQNAPSNWVFSPINVLAN